MNTMANGVLAVLRRDWLIYRSYRMRFITQALSLFFSLTLFYYISRLVKVSAFRSPDDYYAFAVIGLVILQVLNSTLHQPPGQVQGELYAGTFERLLVSPFGPVAALCSTLLFPFLMAVVTSVVMLAFASLAFGLSVNWSTAPLALPAAVLGTLAFSSFGVMMVGVTLIAKQMTAGATWIIAGISLIAGLYFPVSLLPSGIRWASDVQPFTPTVDLMRHALVGTPLTDPVWLEVVKVAGFAAVLLPLAGWTLRACVRASCRRATILEY
jgi:ABC-2 type transport system permease protein